MAVTDTSLGFKFMGCYSGLKERRVEVPFKDTETLHIGDLVNLESGEADLAATNDTSLLGISLETKAGTDSTTKIKVISSPDAMYAVYDPNVRVAGELLDISGVTGQQTVAAPVNNDLIVIAPSAADEWTMVMINHGSHVFN